MWVQLRSIKHVEVNGKRRAYRSGDWVDVGKQTARRWIAQNDAWIPGGEVKNLLTRDCGVFVCGGRKAGENALGDYVGKIDIKYGDWPSLKWSKTLVYSPYSIMRRELLPIGFHLLDTWQVAIPLWDYKELAIHTGSPHDHEKTLPIVRDLRIPLYSPSLVFVRRSPDTQRFLDTWREEQGDGDDARFALLRAIYLCKPLILALPTTWIGKDRHID